MKPRQFLNGRVSVMVLALAPIVFGLAVCVAIGEEKGRAIPLPQVPQEVAADARRSENPRGGAASLMDIASSMAGRLSPDAGRAVYHWQHMVEIIHISDVERADARRDALARVLIYTLQAVERGEISLDDLSGNLSALGDVAEKSQTDYLGEWKRLTSAPELALPGAKVGPNPRRKPY